jgi:hypothetical protein
MTECPHCKKENLDNARYCQECGEKLVEDELKVALIVGTAGMILGIFISVIFFVIPFVTGLFLITSSYDTDKVQGKLFVLFSVATFFIVFVTGYSISGAAFLAVFLLYFFFKKYFHFLFGRLGN